MGNKELFEFLFMPYTAPSSVLFFFLLGNLSVLGLLGARL
jgi:hypothetical protein